MHLYSNIISSYSALSFAWPQYTQPVPCGFCLRLYRIIFPGYNPNTLRVFLPVRNCRSLLLFFHDVPPRCAHMSRRGRQSALPSTIPGRTHTHTHMSILQFKRGDILFVFQIFYVYFSSHMCAFRSRVCVCVSISVFFLFKSLVLPNCFQLGHRWSKIITTIPVDQFKAKQSFILYNSLNLHTNRVFLYSIVVSVG